MRNAVIMMTANPTEDVVADSPPSAPSGRFGGHPRSGREWGSSRRKLAHNAAVSARGAWAAAGVFSSGQSVHLTQIGIFTFPLLISVLFWVTM